jgi:hypothetical protein
MMRHFFKLTGGINPVGASGLQTATDRRLKPAPGTVFLKPIGSKERAEVLARQE